MQSLDSSGFSFCAASQVAVLTLFCYCADAGRTIPMISKPTITGLKNVLHTWQLSRSIDRPGPPDLSRQKHNGIRTAIKFVVGCNDSHLGQQLIRWQTEEGRNARILHGCHSKTAFLDCWLESSRERSAFTAAAVETNPTPGSSTAFTVSYF